MSQLSVASWIMPAADVGPDNPLAPLRAYETASAAGATAPDPDYPDRGREESILPYRLQDQYIRQRAAKSFKTAVLENQFLRATFLLELGGRLWSLVHKPTGRELLYVNPVFQPANLAVRDAWFTGGVEWNISIIGHSPLTCSPIFAGRVETPDGTPVLRLYEWDRIRRVPFQIDCWLAAELPFLFVRVRIINPNDHTVPMYWWSNIAVPECEGTRVISPTELAYRHDYDGRLVEHQVPIYDGVDVTYTTNRRSAADLYFRIPQGHRPWIAAIDSAGRGLVHASTDRLRGRKMFNWGMDAGGRRWQEFLSGPGEAYIEIQGGLAQTQGEYVAMPAGTKWSWLEAYGPIEIDPNVAHGKDWGAVHRVVESELERRLPQRALNNALARMSAIANQPPVELLHQGCGWAALEQIRRRTAISPALPFPAGSLDEQQLPWLALLQTGELPYRSSADCPCSPMVQPEWHELLERSIREGRSAHWLAWYHLGVMRYRAGDAASAKEAWERSLSIEPNPWAKRDLAVVANDGGELREASDLYLAAAEMRPDLAPLAIECAKALLAASRFDAVIQFARNLPPAVRSHGRIRLLGAMASLELGDLKSVAQYFEGDVDIANIREKETTLSDLWFGWQEKRTGKSPEQVRRDFPPPARFDFRLNPLA